VDEARYMRHHKKKIAFLFSAMRHFAAELRGLGWTVEHVALEDAGNRGSFTAQLGEAIDCGRPARVVVTEAGEWRVRQMQASWSERFSLPDRRFRAVAGGAHGAADGAFLSRDAPAHRVADGRRRTRRRPLELRCGEPRARADRSVHAAAAFVRARFDDGGALALVARVAG
jgi:hypothetical protein